MIEKDLMEKLLTSFSNVPDWLSVVLLSALPVTELRAALPVAILYYDFDPLQAIMYALIGNSIPVFLIFWMFPPFLRWAQEHQPRLHTIFFSHLQKLENRHANSYQRWGALFLFIFVAIPLPGSGVWTGSLLAIIFGMKPKLSLPAILLGMVVASLLVLFLSLGIDSLGV